MVAANRKQVDVESLYIPRWDMHVFVAMDHATRTVLFLLGNPGKDETKTMDLVRAWADKFDAEIVARASGVAFEPPSFLSRARALWRRLLGRKASQPIHRSTSQPVN
jgi:hypothetical protein